MYPYIRCNCGRIIGDIWPVFNAMREKMLIELLGDNYAGLVSVGLVDMVSLNPIFDALNITSRQQCCRTKLLCFQSFDDAMNC